MKTNFQGVYIGHGTCPVGLVLVIPIMCRVLKNETILPNAILIVGKRSLYTKQHWILGCNSQPDVHAVVSQSSKLAETSA